MEDSGILVWSLPTMSPSRIGTSTKNAPPPHTHTHRIGTFHGKLMSLGSELTKVLSLPKMLPLTELELLTEDLWTWVLSLPRFWTYQESQRTCNTYMCLHQVQIRLPTLALKPRGHITRSLNRGISVPHKKTYVLQKFLKKKNPPRIETSHGRVMDLGSELKKVLSLPRIPQELELLIEEFLKGSGVCRLIAVPLRIPSHLLDECLEGAFMLQ